MLSTLPIKEMVNDNDKNLAVGLGWEEGRVETSGGTGREEKISSGKESWEAERTILLY